MTKVVIVSGIQIINNPRVVKEATALSQAGFEVEVIGAIFDKESNVQIQRVLKGVSWKHIPIIDLSVDRFRTKLEFFLARIKRSISFTLIRKFDLESKNQLGYFVPKLYRVAKSRQADLYIVHLEQALWTGKKLIENGYRVAIDVEDWYSEDGLPQDRALRPIKFIKECESFLLKNSIYSTSTSKSLATILRKEYESKLPVVIYNSFPKNKVRSKGEKYLDRKNINIPSIIWFSQTIGPGRGLEQLIDALSRITIPYELHIRGTARPGYNESLLENLPVSMTESMAEKIHFHQQVPQDELRSRLIEHDIGYCGELSDCKNHDHTVSNKMMEYLSCGLAVIASDTQGQIEIAERLPDGVFIFDQNSIESLAILLKKLLTDKNILENAKKITECGFDKYFSWNGIDAKIVELATIATDES